MSKKTALITLMFLGMLFPQSIFGQTDPDPETVTPKNIVVNAKVGGVVPGPLEPSPSSSDDDDDSKSDKKKDVPSTPGIQYPGDQDIIVTPVKGYETVARGGIFKARIHLFGFSNNQDIVLEYTVLGPDEGVVLRQTEKIENKTSETFVKSFYLKEEVDLGKYLLLVKASVNDQVAFGSTSFLVVEQGPDTTSSIGVIGKITNTFTDFTRWPFLLILAFTLSLVLFVLSLFLFQDKKMRGWRWVYVVVNSVLLTLLLFLLWRFW
jgi:hypothetical protein